MLCLLFSIVEASTFNVEGNSYEINGLNTIFVNSSEENAIIPEEIQYENEKRLVNMIIPVYNPNIKSITIPQTIISIQNIKNLENLQKIIFSNSSDPSRVLQFIGKSWFDGSSITGTVTIPKSVQNIDSYAFRSTKIQILIFESSEKIISIGVEAFKDCTELQSVQNFPEKTNLHVFDSCFENCRKMRLESVHSINFVEVGNNAFKNSYLGLKIVTLTFFSVGSYAFYGTTIENLVLSFKYKDSFVNEYSFSSIKLNSLQIEIPEGYKYQYFKNYALIGTTINQLYIKNNQDGKSLHLGKALFAGIEFATSQLYSDETLFPYDSNEIYQVIIVTENLIIDDLCFSRTKGLNAICIEALTIEIGDSAFYGSSIKKFSVARVNEETNYENGRIEFIKEKAFADTLIEEISFGFSNYSITTVYPYAFDNCKNLRSIPIISKILHSNSISHTSFYEISLYSKEIETNSIMFCDTLKRINIEPSVEIIHPRFFDYCKSVESITFVDGNTNLEIPDSCFTFYSIVAVNFGNRITTIGSCSFMQTKISGTLNLPKNVEIIKERAFQGCSNLNGLLIMDDCLSLVSIGSNCFQGCTGFNGELHLPPNIVSIGSNCFSQLKFIGNIEIPDKLEIISDHLFFRCQSFSGHIRIGKSVRCICQYAFSECSGLSSIINFQNKEIENVEIQSYAFYNCKSISGTLVLPKGVTIIGDAAFYGCSSLANFLNLPNNLSSLGTYAFAYCKSITGNLILPKSISYIGEHCFQGCTGINRIYFRNKDVEVGDKAFGSMSFECMSGTPKECAKSLNGTSKCYDNTYKDSLTRYYVLAEHCHLLITIRIFLMIFSAIAGSGIIGASISIYYFIYKKKTEQKKRYKIIFSDIIVEEVNSLKSGKTENDVCRSIINRLNDRINIDNLSKEFRLNLRDCRALVRTVLYEKWPSIKFENASTIVQQSFNGITFTSHFSKVIIAGCCCLLCLRCRKLRKYRSTYSATGDELSQLNDSLLT